MKVFKSEKKRKQVLDSYDQLLKQWDVEIKEIDVQTKYGATHCILAGDEKNPPLMLFHGVGDNSAVMWILNMKELSRHFYCIAVDTMGGPGKSQPNENFTKKSFSQPDWINQLADHFQLDRFYLAGVSHGGYMVFNYTVKEPHRVEKAVCLEGGMIIENPMKSMIRTLMLMFPEILLPTRNNMIKIMKKLSTPHSRIYTEHPELVEHMILVMRSHNQIAMTAHPIERYDRESAVKVRNKLYFLFGAYIMEGREKYINVLEDGEFRFKVIEGAGHGVNHDQPAVVHQEMIGFLLG